MDVIVDSSQDPRDNGVSGAGQLAKAAFSGVLAWTVPMLCLTRRSSVQEPLAKPVAFRPVAFSCMVVFVGDMVVVVVVVVVVVCVCVVEEVLKVVVRKCFVRMLSRVMGRGTG